MQKFYHANTKAPFGTIVHERRTVALVCCHLGTTLRDLFIDRMVDRDTSFANDVSWQATSVATDVAGASTRR